MTRKLAQWLLWNVGSRIFVGWYLKRVFNFSRAPGSDIVPPAPFILVANHGTFFDPWFAGYFSYSPLSIMCNDDAFRSGPVTAWYLKTIGAFPKRKGASDYKAMKETLARLSSGSPVCIFPEGQTTWDGETQLIYKGIEKIIKRARCPLVMIRFSGNFLTKPWWAETKRSGRILCVIKVLPADTIKAMSDDEVFDAIRRHIRHSDIKDADNMRHPFTGSRLTEGLERFVWACMQCGAEDALTTSGNEVRCTSCGGAWEMDAHCRFTSKSPSAPAIGDLKDWAEAHRTLVIRRIAETPDSGKLAENNDVILQTLDLETDRFVDRSKGRLTLTKQTLTYLPRTGAPEPVEYPVDSLEYPVVQQKDIFEVRHEGRDYRFLFNRKSPMKWVWYLRYLKGYEEAEARGYL